MDQLNTGANTPENTEAPEGHDEKMLKVVEDKEKELQGEQKPEGEGEKILGKFESQADLEKAYQELEKKLTEQKKPEAKEGGDNEASGDMDENKAAELIQKANIDVDSIASHYYANGGLDESHYDSLEKAGIPKTYVDQYLSGVEAESERLREDLYNEVGGEESFTAMSEWALGNLSEQELQAYNTTIESGDPAAVRSAVMSLAYRFEKNMGKDPKLIGGSNGASVTTGFESVAQLTEAMKDPRYQKDAAYRKEIEQKLARSNIL